MRETREGWSEPKPGQQQNIGEHFLCLLTSGSGPVCHPWKRVVLSAHERCSPDGPSDPEWSPEAVRNRGGAT